MRRIEELVEKAVTLREKGLSVGQIADELNISRETSTWLLTRPKEDMTAPKDISVDWSAIGESAYRLNLMSDALSDLVKDRLSEDYHGVEVVVGISLSGVPLGALVADEFGCELAVYTPRKQFEPGKHTEGAFSRNFADVRGKSCVVVDDVITSGTTMEDTVKDLKSVGAKPLAIAVMVDKHGLDAVHNVPVLSLMKITRL